VESEVVTGGDFDRSLNAALTCQKRKAEEKLRPRCRLTVSRFDL